MIANERMFIKGVILVVSAIIYSIFDSLQLMPINAKYLVMPLLLGFGLAFIFMSFLYFGGGHS